LYKSRIHTSFSLSKIGLHIVCWHMYVLDPNIWFASRFIYNYIVFV